MVQTSLQELLDANPFLTIQYLTTHLKEIFGLDQIQIQIQIQIRIQIKIWIQIQFQKREKVLWKKIAVSCPGPYACIGRRLSYWSRL
jgi:hypothetical protein